METHLPAEKNTGVTSPSSNTQSRDQDNGGGPHLHRNGAALLLRSSGQGLG